MTGLQVEDEEWVQHCLMEYERRRCISKVLSMSSENAVPKGNNYGSDLYRLKMKVVLHSGEIEEKNAIYKTLPESPMRRIGLKMTGFFNYEAKVYKELFPALDNIRKSRGDDDEPSWPICYAVKPKNEGYLLEDLCVSGYKMADRMKGLDLEEAQLALKSLAKFHALSAVAIERYDIGKKDIGKYLLYEASDQSLAIILQNMVELADFLENKWKGEWVEYAGRVRKFKDSFKSRLREVFEGNEGKFATIIHGDCWLNNMLFKYGPDGKPKSIKFIDFQMTDCQRPGIDLHYLFHTSLQVGIMDKKAELLRLYYDCLISNMQRFGYTSELPTFEDIKEGYDKASVIGFGMGMAFRPLMMNASDDAPDMEEIMKDLSENKVVSMSKFDFDGEDYVNTLQYTLRDAKELGVI